MELRKESAIRFDSIKDEAPLARLERAAHGLGIRCSIHLSYRGNIHPKI